MSKKRQTPVFLDVYLNKEEKETFQQFRLDTEERDGKSFQTVAQNERSMDDNGKPKEPHSIGLLDEFDNQNNAAWIAEVLRIDVSSKSKVFGKLSPHRLGPISTEHRVAPTLQRAWEYLHVYPEHVGALDEPTPEWLTWSTDGFRDTEPPSIPNDLPLYFYYERQKLPLHKAIKTWYIPNYYKLAERTPEFYELAHQYWKYYKKIELDDGGEGHGPILMKMLENT